ncbi:MAG: dihydrofolate reductase family protein [Rubrivivax sp.]|nr:dihydrofolate reductase family protein [Rubrivivax sp.]
MPLPPRPEVAVFIAASLDGFIARADGGLDWLLKAQAAAPTGEDFGYAEFMGGVDALVMGRKTFDSVLGFDPWPYAGTPVHVMTRQPRLAVPAARQADVRVCRQTPAELLAALAADGARRVYLDGGELIQACLRDDLVDRLTITTVPVLIGQGRRLWGPLLGDQAWRLQSVRHWDCGFVQTCHVRRRPADEIHPLPSAP